ncbi:MAG: hypothetical protein LUQ36_03020, partial [Methanoregula sp.]|nr:hypothetical protein [Methanoregula sp.]
MAEENIDRKGKNGKKIAYTGIKILLFLLLVQACVLVADGATIDFGQTVSGSIGSGQAATYTFTATAGDTIYATFRAGWPFF